MADCRRDGRQDCVPDAAGGCVHWMRETGVDDDDWSPEPLNLPWSPEAQPMPMTPGRYQVQSPVSNARIANTDVMASARTCM